MTQKKAVALKYPSQASAPFIVAKGRGELAEKILKVANECKVPIEKNLQLVDILTIQEVGSCIPTETYEIVAKIFAFVAKCKM